MNLLINTEDIPIKELHLAGNQITSNQILYLFSLLHIDVTTSYYNQPSSALRSPQFILPSLHILDFNGFSFFFPFLFLDNLLDDSGVKYLLMLITNNVFQ